MLTFQTFISDPIHGSRPLFEFEAEDDDAAMLLGYSVDTRGRDLEIWQGQRFVGLITSKVH